MPIDIGQPKVLKAHCGPVERLYILSSLAATLTINRKYNNFVTTLLTHLCIPTDYQTITATTHKNICSTELLSIRFKTNQYQFWYKQLSCNYGTFYVDFLKSSVKSIRGFIGGTTYCNKLGFKIFFPCYSETKEQTGAILCSFIEFVGLNTAIHSDNHNNFKEGLFKRLFRKLGLWSSFTEPHFPWQNRAGYSIGEVKRQARQLMQYNQTLIRLWCFCYEYSAYILCLCATGRFDLKVSTPYEVVTNYTPDISEYTTFSWFQ